MDIFKDIKKIMNADKNTKKRGKSTSSKTKDGQSSSTTKRISIKKRNQQFYSGLKSVKKYNKEPLAKKIVKKNVVGLFEEVDTKFQFSNKLTIVDGLEMVGLLRQRHKYDVYDSEHNKIYTFGHKHDDIFMTETKMFHIFNSEGTEIAYCHKAVPRHYEETDLLIGADKDGLTYGKAKAIRNTYHLTKPGYTMFDEPIPANIVNINNKSNAFNIVYNGKPSRTFRMWPAMVYKNCKEYFRIETSAKKFGDMDNPRILYNSDLDMDEAMVIFAMLVLYFQGD